MFNLIKRAKLMAIGLIVRGQLVSGEEGVVPCCTPNGVRIIDSSEYMLTGPDAKAFGTKVPVELTGLENTVIMNRRLAACSLLLRPVLLHEEGHVLLDALPSNDWDFLESELTADQYMLSQGVTETEIMAIISMLRFYGPSMLSSGQLEAYEINNTRVKVLIKYLGL